MDEDIRNVPTYIKPDIQDRNGKAWESLCQYIELVEKEEREEFSPCEAIGESLYKQIYTLPKSIGRLKAVKKMWLYGSNISYLPPEIGKMHSLEYFDPYTSYDLQWFPFEITRCKKLKESRVSTRALYGNIKFRMPFPDLTNNHVRYNSNKVNCSVCEKEMDYSNTNQLWISLKVGTDTLPLLVNACSRTCEEALPKPQDNYVQYAHKGGLDIKQPPSWYDRFCNSEPDSQATMEIAENNISEVTDSEETKVNLGFNKEMRLLKLVRKIWEK